MKYERHYAYGFLVLMIGWLGIACLLGSCGEPILDAPYCQEPTPAASITAPIVNGTLSTDRRGTVYVQTATGYCTGTVLAPNTVITAAHCENVTDVLIEGVAWYDIAEDIPHPERSFPTNDIRILHTTTQMPGPYVTLATDDVACYATIAQGYGYGSDGKLHEREVFEQGHTGDQLFASPGIAPGDSGGPLYALTADGYVLLGVTSWGFGSEPNYEGGTGFISVPYHNEWITENIK